MSLMVTEYQTDNSRARTITDSLSLLGHVDVRYRSNPIHSLQLIG